MSARAPLRGPAGRLEAIDRRLPGARAAAVLCHSDPRQGGSMYDGVLHRIACGLHTRGVSTLRFNYRGVGASEGIFEGGDAEVDDVRAAIDHVARDHDEVALVGYSFGAWVGLRAGADDPRVGRLVGLSLPIGPLDVAPLRSIRRPLLLVHGERDAWGELAAIVAFAAAIGANAEVTAVAGGDHGFQGRLDAAAAPAVAFVAGG